MPALPAQAGWANKAGGKCSVLEPFLRQVTCRQLFFARMQRPRKGGPPVGKSGRRVLAPPPLPEIPRPVTGRVQTEPFPIARDYRGFDRRRHEDPAKPWLVQARRVARTLGEFRGWTRWIASDVDRALVVVLCGHAEGETIRYSEIFPALRSLGLSVNRTTEDRDKMGLFVDDRAPAADLWLERKLDGVAPGIRRTVEQWARALLDGGPRSEPRDRNTAWTYLNAIRPALLDGSTRHDHLREIERADVVAVRDGATGRQRETRVVALRSLFGFAKKNGQIFLNPTLRLRAGARDTASPSPSNKYTSTRRSPPHAHHKRDSSSFLRPFRRHDPP
ncbi:hypothetical protein [Embleya sp. NPDC050493]|uniref:hypothetical protein n=1 Tax=Embleya sp. NPDC050493 TaxID=3363989 RepID=UPI0037A432C8